MKFKTICLLVATALLSVGIAQATIPLGLPPVPIPDNNPQTEAKIKLGDKLFHDTRFSTTGDVSCSTCHERSKAFTDTPLSVAEGINKLKGTRNSPTVINSAYLTSQFWDGREPDLEGQSGQPFINPIEMGLKDYTPVLDVIKNDPDYQQQFHAMFNKSGDEITIEEVKMAFASFERTIIAGDSPFDHYNFAGDKTAMSESAVRGLDVFIGQGRCVSCHTISQTHALFTDNRFHNLGVIFDLVDEDLKEMADHFRQAKAKGLNVDIAVLTNKNASELGRLVVTDQYRDIGSFRTPTLRNIDVTAPYMHDGSQATLEEVVDFYNNGGALKEGDPVNAFQSGGIRPLNLNEQQKEDLVAFLKALTSPEYLE